MNITGGPGLAVEVDYFLLTGRIGRNDASHLAGLKFGLVRGEDVARFYRLYRC